MSGARRGGIAAALTAMGLVGACREPTQIFVDVRLRDAACTDVMTTTIAITRDETAETSLSAFSTDACAGGAIGSLAAIPENGGDSGRVFVRVVVGFTRPAETCTVDNGYAGCTVARRRITYKAHTTLRLPIAIDRACENQPCSTRTTCNRDRVCENADLDAVCASDTCDLSSETGGRGDASRAVDAAQDSGNQNASDSAAPEGGNLTDGGGGGPNGRWANTGPGVRCGETGLRCSAPVPYCSNGGNVAMCMTVATTSSLACDESSDCPSGLCCYDFGQNQGRCQVGTCTQELCWVDSTCAAGSSCLNTLSAGAFGDLGSCRPRGLTATTVPCGPSTSCISPDVCNLLGSGVYTCGQQGTERYAACTSRVQCTVGSCVLYPAFGSGAQHAACGASNAGIAELCDGLPNGCSAGRTCTTDVVEVGFGYFLRVCR